MHFTDFFAPLHAFDRFFVATADFIENGANLLIGISIKGIFALKDRLRKKDKPPTKDNDKGQTQLSPSKNSWDIYHRELEAAMVPHYKSIRKSQSERSYAASATNARKNRLPH